MIDLGFQHKHGIVLIGTTARKCAYMQGVFKSEGLVDPTLIMYAYIHCEHMLI